MLELRLERRRREPKTFCPNCGAPLRDALTHLQCPSCGYSKLTPTGKSDAERKLLAGLHKLLADGHGDTVAVTFRKLARAATLKNVEIAYARSQWRKILPAEITANGSRWFQAKRESERIIYKRARVEA